MILLTVAKTVSLRYKRGEPAVAQIFTEIPSNLQFSL